MNSVGRRLLAAAVGACLLSGLVAVGPARADSTPDDLRTWGLTVDLRGDQGLVDAVGSARDQFRLAVASARTSLRTTVDGVRADIARETAAQRIANRAAHDREILMAVATARSSLQGARVLYLRSIASAFAAHAPGTSVPRALLETASWSGIGDGEWLDPLGLRTP